MQRKGIMYRVFMGLGISTVAITCGLTALIDRMSKKNKNAQPQTKLQDLPELEKKLQAPKYIPGEKEKEEKPRGMSLGTLRDRTGIRDLRQLPLVQKDAKVQKERDKDGYI